MPKLTYQSSGINYNLMDKLKRLAQNAASSTEKNISDTNFIFDQKSRGESAAVIKQPDGSYAVLVVEGLGTKNIIADAMSKITGKTYYDSIAQDTIAMIVNDLITVGARPISILAYWAAGSADWFTNEKRMEDLVDGWQKACNLSGAVWAGGETPTLPNVIQPDTIDLGGTGFGIADESRLIDGEKLVAGDRIILFESSGIHSNGPSFARKIAASLPEGYKTKLPSGRMYGEALLDPTIIYAKLIQDLFANNIKIHYMANITGHGWRKLMRHTKKLTYKITSLPPVPEVLQFIQQKAELEDKEAYGTFNMGAGFALFVPQDQVQNIIDVSSKNNIKAYHVGNVEEGEKQVIIEPINVTFAAESLQVRA